MPKLTRGRKNGMIKITLTLKFFIFRWNNLNQAEQVLPISNLAEGRLKL